VENSFIIGVEPSNDNASSARSAHDFGNSLRDLGLVAKADDECIGGEIVNSAEQVFVAAADGESVVHP
jgi:hypothetical protein